jgi:predicted secreted hydrolase
MDVVLDDWRLVRTPTGELKTQATGEGFSLDLTLAPTQPLLLQGQEGFSRKGPRPGQASYYYSLPHLKVTGVLGRQGRRRQVRGQAWLDREWSSQPLAGDQSGWDWFSLHFDSGDKMMAFRLRGGGGAFTSASWITAEGDVTPMGSGDLVLTPLDRAIVAGRRLPVAWRIDVPLRGVSVTTRALNKQAWMATSVPYWEGPVSVDGSHPGRGYLEMTGYE